LDQKYSGTSRLGLAARGVIGRDTTSNSATGRQDILAGPTAQLVTDRGANKRSRNASADTADLLLLLRGCCTGLKQAHGCHHGNYTNAFHRQYLVFLLRLAIDDPTST
jgi:hypothetical protein